MSLHKNAHLDENNMHEVKGFPSASIGYASVKGISGASEWLRNYRRPNVISEEFGYKTPPTENDGDIYTITAPLLEIANVTWTSGTSVKFTFDSGYDSSLYGANDYLQVSGVEADVHNGVWLITTVNAGYLVITNADVTDGTADQTGSAGTGYVTMADFDPENLANGQSIPRVGQVVYKSNVDLWYGNEFETGDCFYNEETSSLVCWNGTAFASETKRLTSTDSPYTVLTTDRVLFCNTDSGAITLNVLAGIDGKKFKIINTGSSGNDVTVDPNASEKIYGSTSSFVLIDSEIIDIDYNATDGWW